MNIPLTDVSGIGPNIAKDLQAHDIASAEDLATSSLAEIMAVPGFGEIRALRVKEAAAAAIRTAETPAEPTPTASKSKKKSGKKKSEKEKKSKEDKKSKKKKGKKDKKKK